MTVKELNKFHSCGTAACIAGHADVLFEEGLDALGLYPSTRSELFIPTHDYARFDAEDGEKGYITREDAVRCLRNLARTGIVDWSFKEEQE